MALILCIIFSLIILPSVICENTEADVAQGEMEPEIAQELAKLGEKTKNPLIQLLGRYFQRIENKFDEIEKLVKYPIIEMQMNKEDNKDEVMKQEIKATERKLKRFFNRKLDTLKEAMCSISMCTEWSKWTKCDSNKQQRTRKCEKAALFCSKVKTRHCEACNHGHVRDPTKPGNPCTDLRPRVTVMPLKVERREGSTIVYQCQVTGDGPINVVWRRQDGRKLPDRAIVSPENSLTIRNIQRDDSGRYVCAATNQYGVTRREVVLKVSVAPRLTISPQRIKSRAGDTIQVRCAASGSGPFSIEWSRIGAQMNPSATEEDGILEIRRVTAADAGRYRCVVSSSSGSQDGYALVEIEIPPSVVVAQRNVYTEVNRIVRLQCDVTGDPLPVVRWEKVGDALPAQHKIQDGVLTIYNVQEEDAGLYICSVTSSSGSARDYATLHVSTDSEIDKQGSVDTQVVQVGDRVSIECTVSGNPMPTITWSREYGPLPANVILGDGILVIPHARVEDAGTYACLAVNEAGSISSKVVLYVKA